MGIYLVIFLFFKSTFGASCCGGGSSMPSLITGDVKTQISAVASNSATTEQTDSDGNLIGVRNSQVRESLVLSGSYLLGSYWQIGVTLPLIKNTTKTQGREESSSGLGDISLQAAYEFLPELGYSPWKPRGFLFFEQSFPTSPSTYDANNPLRTDSRGAGLASTSIGLALIKTYPSWDWLGSVKLQHFYQRTFSEPQKMKVAIKPSWSAMIGAGKSLSDFRLGLNLTTTHMGAREITGFSKAQKMITTAWSTSLSYMIAEESSLSLSYSDQSLLKPSQNSPLLKTLALTFTTFSPL